MPGFLIFDELGMDDKGNPVPEINKAAMKSMLAMLPGSWMRHGLGGEYNVDVDPVAEINKALDGGGALGAMSRNAESAAQGAAESAAEGSVAGVAANVAAGATSLAGQFWEAYKGWIPVVNVSQSFNSDAVAKDASATRELEATRKAADMALTMTREELRKNNEKLQKEFEKKLPDEDLDISNGGPPTSSGQKYSTKMSGETTGVERISVEVHLDVSFPKLLKAALMPHGDKDGPRVFPSADIHLCTVASVDTRQITMGKDGPAAQLIQTLIGFFLFNVVPYVTISMKDVQIAEVSYNLQGEASGTVPTASVVLEYKEVTWAYHVINGSNMNLITTEFGYDVAKHKPAEPELGGVKGVKIGSTLNPFA